MFGFLGKLFQPVASAVTRIGSGILGVGKAVFNFGAANNAGSIAQGGFGGFMQRFTGGNGILGNVLSGAISQAAVGALGGAAVGALTGTGIGRGALMGGLGGAVSGGVMGASGVNANPFSENFGQKGLGTATGVAPAANTATGMAPTGATASRGLGGVGSTSSYGRPAAGGIQASTVVTPQQTQRRGLFANLFGGKQGGNILDSQDSPWWAGALEGAGESLSQYSVMSTLEKGRMDRLNRQIQAQEDQEQRLRDSYKLPSSVYHQPTTGRASTAQRPSEKYARTPRYRFDPTTGAIEMG